MSEAPVTGKLVPDAQLAAHADASTAEVRTGKKVSWSRPWPV